MNYRHQKHFLLLLSAIFTTSCLISCGGSNSTDDTDHDGLIDKIDPNPRSNKYNVRLQLDEHTQSKDFELEVDYREYIKEGYNKDLSLLTAFIVNETDSLYGTFGSKPIIMNDVYKPSLETLLPFYGQIGGENIESKELIYEKDSYDVATLYFMHHTLDNNGNKYQFFFTVIDGYIHGGEQWVSNFDVGAWDEDNDVITNGYRNFWHTAEHEDWQNHNHHKGFDVSAVRCTRAINEYVDKYQKEDARKIYVVIGHSRAAAITNLVAKNLIDENKDVRAYCFNPPGAAKATDEELSKEKYKNIFVLNNTSDLISRVPCPNYWGFKRYGTVYDVDVDKAGAKLYEDYFGTKYGGCSEAFLNVVEAQLADLSIAEGIGPGDSNGIYMPHYRDSTGFFDYEVFDNATNAERFINFIKKYYDDLVIHDFFKNSDDTWTVKWNNQGCLIIRVLENFAAKNVDFNIWHITLLRRLLTELIDGIISAESFDYILELKDRIMDSHAQKTSLIMAICVANSLNQN